jgi:beta-glucosidase
MFRKNIEKGPVDMQALAAHKLGAVLGGGGAAPEPNEPAAWRAHVASMQAAAARATRAARALGGVPLLIGNDSVHGHANLRGATLFPHHIGQGCMNDAALVEELARLSCRESHACGINWMFAPCCTVPDDLRWGRTYEAFSDDPAVVAELAAAEVRGIQTCGVPMAACVKHWVADGATALGTGTKDFEWTGAPVGVLDQGDAQIDERELRERHVAAYLPALAASGAAAPLTVMVSYSSWNGVKAHASRYLVTTLLKEELGFGGLVVSDFNGVQQCCPDDFKAALALALNAGIDMVMTAGGMYGDVPLADQLEVAERAVGEGLVPMARIDDAVRRILRVKAAMRLLDDAPPPQPDLDGCVGCAAHRATARAAVRKSLVLLRNERGALPLAAAAPLLVAGRGAHDLGMQCGGWSMEWLGFRGNEATEGTTIYDGVRAACVGAVLLAEGEAPPPPAAAPVAVVVVGEAPYAEAAGDTHDLTLDAADAALIDALHDPTGARTLVCVLLCGRPLVLPPPLLAKLDALVVAWLPGTEGAGVADLLFGDAPFEGRLSFSWPRDNAQARREAREEDPLFRRGFGL